MSKSFIYKYNGESNESQEEKANREKLYQEKISEFAEHIAKMSIPAPIEPPVRSLRATLPAAKSHYSGGGNHHSGN